MRPYQNTRLIEEPDIYDIKVQGRKSSVGRIKRGEESTVYVKGLFSRQIVKVCHKDRGYLTPRLKWAVRRYLKRRDRAISARLEREAEE